MNPFLTSTVVWITGAARGIGRSTADLFADAGAIVVVSGRTKSTLERVAAGIAKRGGACTVVPCDVRDEKSVARAIKVIIKKHGRVDVLINNAGIGPWKDFTKTSIKEFDDTIATNLRGVFICSQAVAPGMIEQQSGTIINVLSTASIRAFPGNSAYCAAKFGALGLTKVMRSELKKHKIRVIAVMPGAVDTPMWDAKSRKQYADRMLLPEDVARTMLDAVMLPDRAVAEEIVLRPWAGDI
jgi:NAD(P)-dependent dehydrogenase (short-subunit alcohol dehydrogenase family)